MNQHINHKSDVPIQPVDKPIICNPYEEPRDFWDYDKGTGAAFHGGKRRPAGYWYKTERVGTDQRTLYALDEDFDELPLVNLLREDVRRWREADYRGASNVTRELLQHWNRTDRGRRLFFCQREAVETFIYLAELRMAGRASRTGFQKFSLSDDDLQKLLRGDRPSFALAGSDFAQTLIDRPIDPSMLPLRRLGCKMATGSGKTVVMSMLIAWAFCNRGQNHLSKEYPSAVLICCPNLTVKERLQVLRPELPINYYDEFDIVPSKFRPFMQFGRVLVTNWHVFAPESEHKDGNATHRVVEKGPETPESFAKRVLGPLADRMPIMVLNDEGHHCWRPAPETEEEAARRGDDNEDPEEAKVWLGGLDWINNSIGDGKPGISYCVDLSATPFHIKGSGYPEGRPFPWIVSDFGLVDAIESGIVKIPRLPVQDTTGRPDPVYFRLWESMKEHMEPADYLPGKPPKPKPEVVYREAEGALQQIAGQWVERFQYVQDATPGQNRVPPVLIIVCDNTDIAKVFYEKISGEREEEVVTEADLTDSDEDEENDGDRKRKKSKAKLKTRTIYGRGRVQPEYLSNTSTEKRTIRIDSKLLAEAESDDPTKNRRDAAEALRRVVATVGKRGEPGEHVRCVVSVSMLTEGWDANNVTNIFGVRAFGSQLLCEQVVGRGLRRMDYDPDPETGMLTEEYVDVYGIPFSVIPFKGRPTKSATPEDKPQNHVKALDERSAFEIRFPIVEGYTFALNKYEIRCDVDSIEPIQLQPSQEPTATYLLPTVGYAQGDASRRRGQFAQHDRDGYYESTHPQEIKFEIARLLVDRLSIASNGQSTSKGRKHRLEARHQLFPKVYRIVEAYIDRRVDLNGCDPCEIGLEKYAERIIERIADGILPDESAGEPPLLPVLNRTKAEGTSADVDFKTRRPCWATQKSHIDQVVADTLTWEQAAAFRLEQCEAVKFYARNDHLGCLIPYEYLGVDHSYEPDFLVRLRDDTTIILETKGHEPDRDKAKHNAAKRWVEAANNWGKLGRWRFHVCHNPQLLLNELEMYCKK